MVWYDDVCEYVRLFAYDEVVDELGSDFAYPAFLHSTSKAATRALKSQEPMLPKSGWLVDHLLNVRRGEVMPKAMRAKRRGSSRSGQAFRMARIWAGSGLASAAGSNSTPDPVLQNVHFPHKPSGTAFSSPKYDARDWGKPMSMLTSVRDMSEH